MIQNSKPISNKEKIIHPTIPDLINIFPVSFESNKRIDSISRLFVHSTTIELRPNNSNNPSLMFLSSK